MATAERVKNPLQAFLLFNKRLVPAMTQNIGLVDRRIRIVLGFAILLIGLFVGSWWGLVGVILLATGLIRWCPLYAPFKISTLRRQSV